MRTLTIDSGKGEKTRSFQVALLGIVTCEWLVATTDRDIQRPLWMALAGSEAQMRAFVANLQGGKKASDGDKKKIELLKTSGYVVSTQREIEGVIATAYLPDLVRLDPGMVDPDGARFLMVVPRDWIATQAIKADAISAAMFCKRAGFDMARPEDAAVALLFAGYLDRRTRAPIVADLAFAMQLYYASLQAGLASPSSLPATVADGRHRHHMGCVMLTLKAWYHHNHTVMGMWTSSAVRYRVADTSRALDLARGLIESWYANQPPFEIELSDGESTWAAKVNFQSNCHQKEQ
jgi:hypothetical protein